MRAISKRCRRKGTPSLGSLVSQCCRRWLISQCRGIVVALSAFGGVQVDAAIQHIANGFLISGTNASILISDTNGSILSVATGSGGILTGGEAGLWSATFKEGGAVNATAFQAGSTASPFQWTLPSSNNSLLLTYSNADITVTVTLSNRDDAVDLSAQVQPKQKWVWISCARTPGASSAISRAPGIGAPACAWAWSDTLFLLTLGGLGCIL